MHWPHTRIVFKFAFILTLVLTACSEPEISNSADQTGIRSLESLRQERKFEPTAYYMGPDTPEDELPLIALVNGAIDDIAGMSRPLDMDKVRKRLKQLVSDVDLFATEDRDRTYRYAIHIWQAVGFDSESELFGVSNSRVLRTP